MAAEKAAADNCLLAALPRSERLRVLAASSCVRLGAGEILSEPDAPIAYAYFPTAGAVSLLTALGGNSLEVALVGDEGMVGVPLVLGVATSPWRAFVQGDGEAWRIDGATLRRFLEQGGMLRKRLERYILVLLEQFAQTAACTHFHLIEARLANRLLTTADRAHADEFRMTHEYLAQVLGVRRVGITNAASALQERRLISYSRGEVTILDRKGLQAAACDCYLAARQTYERLLAQPRRPLALSRPGGRPVGKPAGRGGIPGVTGRR